MISIQQIRHTVVADVQEDGIAVLRLTNTSMRPLVALELVNDVHQAGCSIVFQGSDYIIIQRDWTRSPF